MDQWESELERVTALTYGAAEDFLETVEPTIREGVSNYADLQIEMLEKQLQMWKDFRGHI